MKLSVTNTNGESPIAGMEVHECAPCASGWPRSTIEAFKLTRAVQGFCMAKTQLTDSSRRVMTQINYPNLTRTSPSANLRLEIRSPDNDPDSPRNDPENRSRQFWGGFQKDFTFTVRRTDSSEIVWQRDADHESLIDMPKDAWVGDDGHVVVITRTPFSSDLFVLDTNGEVSLHCDVASVILENNEAELHWTSAGPHWNTRGLGMFFGDKSTRWWCFRTELGR